MSERDTYTKAAWIETVSQTIYKNYKYLITEYLDITSTGKAHFEHETFKELFSDAQKRYNLYGKVVIHTLEALEDLLEDRRFDIDLWKHFKCSERTQWIIKVY